MEKEKTKERIQWHPAFYAATQLEFRKDSENLEFQNEKKLSNAPLSVDVLIIKKKPGITTKSTIGRIFRQHNIIEYKAIRDSLNVDVFYKVIAYACLYKTRGKHVNENDISITIVRFTEPRGLMKWFSENGYGIEKKYNGIYYIKGAMFPCQVIVINDLDHKEHIWMKALTDRIDRKTILDIEAEAESTTEIHNKRLMRDVLYASITANKDRFKEEEKQMDAIQELFGYNIVELKDELKETKADLEKAEKAKEKEKKAREKEKKAKVKAEKAWEKSEKARERSEKENRLLKDEIKMLKKKLAAQG